jgi:hypothetical protein
MSLRIRIDLFVRKGPFTFAKALELAKECGDGDWDFNESLDDCCWKFPPDEFAKLLNPLSHCVDVDYQSWVIGTKDWKLRNTTGQFNEAQLKLIAKAGCHYIADIRIEKMDYDHKLQVIRIHNESVRRRLKDRVDRDESPSRK